MRSRLFSDQNRIFICNIIFLRNRISCGIGSDRKLTDRKCLMIVQNVIENIFFIFFFWIKIGAGILCDLSFFKTDLQIVIRKSVKKYLAHKKGTFCSFQYRGSEHLTYRDIDIGNTVFKDRLFCRIGKRMKHHFQIRLVFAWACYFYILSFIQCIDHCLLHLLVKLVIQSIDLDRFIKDLMILLSDFRNRPGNDRKASLISRKIFIGQTSGSSIHRNQKFFLLFA